MSAIDDVTGLADRLTTKILCPKMPRGLSLKSMGPILAALGLKLLVIEDPETTARYTDRAAKLSPSALQAQARRASAAGSP
jgi:hypothetical protein